MKEIIVGVDDTTTARVAAEHAAEMATAYNRPLHIVTAVSHNTVEAVRAGRDAGAEVWYYDSFSRAESVVQSLAGSLKTTTPVTTAVLNGGAAEALVEEAKRLDASIIVIGNKRVQGAARVLGSIAGDVAKSAHCNVYIVHTF